MKKIITLSLFFIYNTSVSAQVAIGKETIEESAILTFGEGTTNGIILPYVNNFTGNFSNGSILVDVQNLEEVIVKVKIEGNWIPLTSPKNQSNLELNTTQDVGNGIIIGSATSNSEGVLVLESENKALILPKIDDVTLIPSPVLGMICYDLQRKSMAIFDGIKWSFWN